MIIRPKLIVLVIAIAQIFALSGAYGAQQDLKVYVVYDGRHKSPAKTVIGLLPENVKARKYNTDLLQLADYTAKQKVVSKLSNSDYIILVGDNTREIFGPALNSATIFEIKNEDEAVSFDFASRTGALNDSKPTN